MSRAKLLTIFFIVFINVLGFGLILPLLPYYARTYGATAWVTGLLVASYAAAQLVGGPILGRLSDRHGRRPVLLVSIGGTSLGFALLALAAPLGAWLAGLLAPGNADAVNFFVLGVMFASRILAGLTGGSITVAQAYITDVTTAEDRASGLGLLGAAFGLGFVVGPAVGGLLSNISYAAPAFLAAIIAALNGVGAYFFLPESLTPERKAEVARNPRAPFSVAQLRISLAVPGVGSVLQTRFFFGLAFAMFQTIFSLYASGAPLHLSAPATGLVLAFVGVIVAVVQGLGIRRLTARYAEALLLFVSAIAMVAGFLLWGATPTILLLLIALVPISAGGGIINTLLNSVLTKVVVAEEVGATLGLSTAVESGTRVIAPALGGVLLSQYGVWGPALFCTVLMLWVTILIWRRLMNGAAPDLASDAMQST